MCCVIIEVERELKDLPEAAVAEMAVLMEDEEAVRERALGRRSKAIRRKSMTLFICEKFVYVLLIGFCFDRSRKITNVGSQHHEISCGERQRMFNAICREEAERTICFIQRQMVQCETTDLFFVKGVNKENSISVKCRENLESL